MKQAFRIHSFLPVLFLSLLLTGCLTVKWVSDYDEATDNALTSLQSKMEKHFLLYENNPVEFVNNYEGYKNFYDAVRLDLSAIKFRVDARPLNELSSQQIDLFSGIVDDLEELHKDGLTERSAIASARQTVNSSLSSMLKLELAKKRGET